MRFTPNGSGYDLTRADGGFRASLGTRIVLEDDDSSGFDVPFTFAFYGTAQPRGFINSDGNITFGEGDSASTERSVSRFLSGVPRIAPFFADLDPTTGSGRVFLATGPDGVTVTWCNVRGFDLTDTVTVQTTMLPTGVVEMRFGANVGLDDAVVGLSPGRTSQFSTVDLSGASGSAAPATALGERFSQDTAIDLAAVARKFYQTHPDNYDQLVTWTDTRVVTGNTFAFETTVANEVRGIGTNIFDQSRDFGSAGRLRSLVMMDALTKYPASPTQRFLGEDSTISLLGQESGHRWLAFFRFRDANGQRSDALLGRDQAHWSFFFDSDASFMEGNDIEDLGGGAFRTVGAVSRYSLLDQYAMGLVSPSQVPPFFYVEAPTNVVPDTEPEDAPDVGVTFNGTKREVRIQDVIDTMGRREPSSSSSPQDASSGLHLHRLQRPDARPGAGGQGGPHSTRMGQRVPHRHQQPHDARDEAAVNCGLRIADCGFVDCGLGWSASCDVSSCSCWPCLSSRCPPRSGANARPRSHTPRADRAAGRRGDRRRTDPGRRRGGRTRRSGALSAGVRPPRRAFRRRSR